MSLSEKELEGCGPEAGAAAEAADVRPTQEDVAGLREAIARLAADNARLLGELARSEERCAESNERFRSVLDQSIDVVFRRNLKTDCYDYLSPSIEAVTGFTVDEFCHIPLADFIPMYVHPDDRAAVGRRFEQFEKSRLGEKVKGFSEYRFRCKDGRYKWISDSGVQVNDADGTPLYQIGVARDVTDLKRVEGELRRSNEELEKKVYERTARLRHLASELVLAEQRERKRLSDFLHDDLQQVLVAAKFGAERVVSERPGGDAECQARLLIDYVMEAVGKVRAFCSGLTTPLLYVVGLVPALRELAEKTQSRYGLRVIFEEEDIPDIDDEAVKVQVFQSASELLFNAAKHSGSDTACLRVGYSGGRVEMEVTDSGKGFDAASVMGEGLAGHGCGLFSVRERVTALGGEVRIESSVGRGTCVKVFLPVSPSAAATPAVGERPESSSGTCAVSGGGRARVLIADDHEMVRAGLINLLSQNPRLEVVGEARNGWEAVTLSRQVRPDVIVMDIKMPEMDGIEATRLIRSELPSVTVIGLSAFGDDGFRSTMLDAGAADLLDKAEAGVKLMDRIAQCLVCRNEGPEATPAVQ